MDFIISCEECDFNGNAEDYLDHMRNNHGRQDQEIRPLDKGRKTSVTKPKPDNFVIPCDLCKFVGNSTTEYLKHVENLRAKETAKGVLPCDLCDFVAKSVKNLKDHLESSHMENHKSKETPEATLSCDLCNFVTNNVKNYKDHLESSHGFKIKSNNNLDFVFSGIEDIADIVMRSVFMNIKYPGL